MGVAQQVRDQDSPAVLEELHRAGGVAVFQRAGGGVSRQLGQAGQVPLTVAAGQALARHLRDQRDCRAERLDPIVQVAGLAGELRPRVGGPDAVLRCCRGGRGCLAQQLPGPGDGGRRHGRAAVVQAQGEARRGEIGEVDGPSGILGPADAGGLLQAGDGPAADLGIRDRVMAVHQQRAEVTKPQRPLIGERCPLKRGLRDAGGLSPGSALAVRLDQRGVQAQRLGEVAERGPPGRLRGRSSRRPRAGPTGLVPGRPGRRHQEASLMGLAPAGLPGRRRPARSGDRLIEAFDRAVQRLPVAEDLVMAEVYRAQVGQQSADDAGP